MLAVIAIQAALLLPALARARNLTRGALCLGHLRHWGLATHLYAADHDDLLPPEGAPNPTARDRHQGWYVQLPFQLGLPPYHEAPWRTNPEADTQGTPFLCPSNPRRSNGRNLFHYCLNRNLDGSGDQDAPVRLSQLNRPAHLVWLFDSKNLPAVGSWSFTHTNLHGGGAQFLFLDGHAQRFPATWYWEPAARRARTNLPDLVWIP